MSTMPMMPPPPQGAGGPVSSSAPASPSPLVKPSQTAPSPGAPNAQAIMQQFMDIHTRIEDLAGSFPESADDMKDASDALISGMQKVVANLQRGTEVPGPQLG